MLEGRGSSVVNGAPLKTARAASVSAGRRGAARIMCGKSFFEGIVAARLTTSSQYHTIWQRLRIVLDGVVKP